MTRRNCSRLIHARETTSGRNKLVARQTGLADLAEDVENEFVRFLDARRAITFDDKIDIGNPNSRSSVASEERDRR